MRDESEQYISLVDEIEKSYGSTSSSSKSLENFYYTIPLSPLSIKPRTYEKKKFPVSTRIDYFTEPSIKSFQKMNKKQLERVVNFKITRKDVGFIYFEGETDLSNWKLNFDEIISIEDKFVETYPNDQRKPKTNEELNRKAIVHL